MSAVDYLFEQLWEQPKDKLTWYAILKQAKEMEWQQIIDAWDNGYTYVQENSEQYYKETFEIEETY